MRKVLIIAYYFPPLGLAGSIRWTKFAKYLPHFGYQPIILTVKPVSYYFYDQNLLNEIKGTKIYRCESFDPARAMYLLKGDSPISPTITKPSLLLHSLFFPDAKILWIPFAYHAAQKIIKKEDPDIILTSSPPYSSLVLGLLLKKRFSIPLVTEFRDPWPMSIYEPNYLQKSLIKRFHKYLHANVDHMISVSKQVSEELEMDTNVITHGYDPDDFESKKSTKYQLVHIGTTFGHEDEMQLFLDCVSELGVEFHLTGNITPTIQDRVSQIESCHHLGLLPHQETMKLINNSQVLVYFYPAKKNYPTSRLYEYIGTGKPILAISRHTKRLRSLVERENIGVTAPVDQDLIMRSINHLLKNRGALSSRQSLKKYDFSNLTKDLVRIFDLILAEVKS